MGRTLFLTVSLLAVAVTANAAESPRPDLIVRSVAAPAAAAPGDSITVQAGVKNRGRVRARRSATRFLLSKDAKPSRGDVALGRQALTGLRPGRTSRRGTVLKLPSGVADGDYRVLACADGGARITEASERNNCRASSSVLRISAKPASDPGGGGTPGGGTPGGGGGTPGGETPGSTDPGPPAAPACSNGVDDDGDTYTDWSAVYIDDPGCTSASDTSERGPAYACDNGIDDDGDGAADAPEDKGCYFNAAGDPYSSSERNAPWMYSCDNGQDDDGDGFSDYSVNPAINDPGCTSSTDTEDGPVACDNSEFSDTGPYPRDDDGDGRSNYRSDGSGDPGCSSLTDTSEHGSAQCDNGTDDDGDGLYDYHLYRPGDPGCSSLTDTSELGTAVCDDGVDNDGDGVVDYPDDSGCLSQTWSTERGECQDDIDNDGDGTRDHPGSIWVPSDPGCTGPLDNNEIGECQDGVDNDGDVRIDWNSMFNPFNDPECADRADPSESS